MNMGIRKNKGVFEAEARLWLVDSSVCMTFDCLRLLQDLLHRHPAVHLRLRYSRSFSPEALEHWWTHHGMGYR